MNIYLKGGVVIDTPQNILIENDFIKEISDEDISLPENTVTIDCKGKIILPGVIDAHVHFRQPGAEYKADMQSESLAALAGGVTTVFDMPNNTPTITSKKTFYDKLELAKNNMRCNFKLFFGVTNNNIEEAMSFDDEYLAGLKLFLGSSTGNMLVDDVKSIETLFKKSKKIIVAHCEDEQLIKTNKAKYENLMPLPNNIHALIRDNAVCYKSTKLAVDLAKKYDTDFHIAHITTKEELSLLTNQPLDKKHITSEVSVNHLLFCNEDYEKYGNLIKCNPAIKSKADRDALRRALKDGYIDMIATDHAPHLLEEKRKNYFQAPSGIPSLQFSLLVMLEIAKQENWNIRMVVEKMCSNPAIRFGIKKRGFIKKGYFADLILVNPNEKTQVTKDTVLSKCKWSPFEGKTFSNKLEMTILNGKIVYKNGDFNC